MKQSMNLSTGGYIPSFVKWSAGSLLSLLALYVAPLLGLDFFMQRPNSWLLNSKGLIRNKAICLVLLQYSTCIHSGTKKSRSTAYHLEPRALQATETERSDTVVINQNHKLEQLSQ